MKKAILLSCLFLFFGISVFAKHIDENTAKAVGKTFLTTKTNAAHLKNANNLALIYKVQSNMNNLGMPQEIVLFYVFNVNDLGFVIVAGDDNATPILAYSDQGIFDPDNIPQNTQKWLASYKSQIRDIIEEGVLATPEITEAWSSYTNNTVQSSAKSVSAVNPLVAARWNQSPYYNALCPSNSVTGCVATAMAQIMKYWNYPAMGSGFHSYNHQTYGTLSANFGSTTYQWSSMPNTVNSPNNAVATLMYQVGVSVNMNYSPQSSGAYVISAQSPVQHCSEYALKTYFGYKSSLQGVQRSSYTQTQWVSLLKTELNASRPILYAGFGSGGGHAFVCDGYDNNDFFHFNWGWGGAYDGYFSINALNPSGTGTGGGSGGYNSGHQAVIGIEPPAGNPTFSLALNNYVTPSASTIYYGNAFNISTNILNTGSGTYSGDYTAAIFDNQYNFIDYVEVKTGYSLQAGFTYTNNLVFQNSGLFSMLPGTYNIGIFYRPTGGSWAEVANNGSYSNWTQINVINPNNIELYSTMTVSPSTTLIKGQSASVNLNIRNTGSTNFVGQYQVNLYNLDGSFVQTINTINENSGLPPSYVYLSPYLTFSTTSITANPGTYLLAVVHKSSSSSTWQLTGSSYFQNPIKVTVQAPSLSVDLYENNNTLLQAYNLPVSFSGNTATRNTSGSNLHTETDNDFYKIALPSGYNYSINVRLHDSYNSGNGNVYSVDALFSYSTNGTTWSDSYDHVMPGNITVNGGGTVYFHLAPYFAGETGTYLLDMTITRTENTGVEEIASADFITIFPNPAKDFVMIDLDKFVGKLTQINLLNVTGQQVGKSLEITSPEKLLRFPLQDLPNGVYFIQIHSSQGILTKKIILQQ